MRRRKTVLACARQTKRVGCIHINDVADSETVLERMPNITFNALYNGDGIQRKDKTNYANYCERA